MRESTYQLLDILSIAVLVSMCCFSYLLHRIERSQKQSNKDC